MLSGLNVIEVFAEGNTSAQLKKIKCTYKMKNLVLLGKLHTGTPRETNEVRNVHKNVNHMPGEDVDRELRTNWTRKS